MTIMEIYLGQAKDTDTTSKIRTERRVPIVSSNSTSLQPDESANPLSVDDEVGLASYIWEPLSTYKPPKTPGAFIHVSKTGGSTLAALLRNGCHSFVKKPCHEQQNESYASLLTTYYHIPDFENGKIHQYPHDFYIISVRDPLDRCISGYSVAHPDNIIAWKYIEKFGDALDEDGKPSKHFMKKLNKKRKSDKYALAYDLFSCFPTLEDFAMRIGKDHNDFKLEKIERETAMPVSNKDCDKLARGVIHNKFKLPMQHQFWNLQALLTHGWEDKKTLFIARNEQKWQDWIVINEMLGQEKGTVVTFPKDSRRNSTNFYLPVGRELSETGRLYLCNALYEEYVLYMKLLEKAVNLRTEDKKESLTIAKKNCPNIFDKGELIKYK